ncbi:MAG: phospholipid carrier-dependent glycosyltransferase [Streptosporangiaceae bacterium]
MRWFAGVFAAGVLLRLVAVLGYRPALWFNDSFDYVQIALKPWPHPIRPDGYGIFLWLLRPFHSFGLVVVVQHLLGLAVGVMIFSLLRRRGLPPWGAALAAAPVLLDGGLIELEHLILSDTLFLFLLTASITLLLWPDRLTWRWAGPAGLLLSLATLTRTVGLPVVLVVLVLLVFGRTGWRAAVLVAATALLPLAGYAAWFHGENGRYAITATDGVFLWGRSAAFAECPKIPQDLRDLCPAEEVGHRRASSSQVWAADSPLGWTYGEAFDPQTNRRAQRFALAAIRAQPLDYLETVSSDFFVRTFSWNRTSYPTPVTSRKYRFPTRVEAFPTWPVLGGGTPATVAGAYDPAPRTRIVEPFAVIMRGYQAVLTLRGPMLAVILLLPLHALRRRLVGHPALLPWLASVTLLAVPPLTVDFDYRYALTAVPLAALAAGLAYLPRAASTAS